MQEEKSNDSQNSLVVAYVNDPELDCVRVDEGGFSSAT